MRITASGGTDAANIVLFWPDNLPDDADARLKKDPIGLIESQRRDGKLIWFRCYGDGAYSVAIYLDEPLPEELVAACADEERYPVLVAKRTGYFGGIEGVFKHDSRFLDKYPSMCETVELPDGTYSAVVYETEVSDELYQSWLLERVGPEAKGQWDAHNAMAAGSVAGVLAALISFFFVPWLVWAGVLAVVAVVIAGAVVTSKSEGCEAVVKAQADFAKVYPSYVVLLESADSGSGVKIRGLLQEPLVEAHGGAPAGPQASDER